MRAGALEYLHSTITNTRMPKANGLQTYSHCSDSIVLDMLVLGPTFLADKNFGDIKPEFACLLWHVQSVDSDWAWLRGQNVCLRPITSTIGSPTYALSRELSQVLSPDRSIIYMYLHHLHHEFSAHCEENQKIRTMSPDESDLSPFF